MTMDSQYDIILRPLVTEKTNRMMAMGKYTFVVRPDANKIQVRKAVEAVFKVKVVKVCTINVQGKPKRMGRFLGRTASWKKAIVTLAPGSRIEFFEGVGA
jgi:large subunit ribosomal protein L23